MAPGLRLVAGSPADFRAPSAHARDYSYFASENICPEAKVLQAKPEPKATGAAASRPVMGDS